MAFNVSAFRTSILDRDIIRPSKFRARIFSPPGLSGPEGMPGGELELWGEAAQVPMFQLGSGQMQRYGYGSAEKRPVMPQYQEISLRFYADADGRIWRFFKDWLRLIVNNDPDAGEIYELSYKDEYLTDIQITVFKQTGEESFTATMVDAFPIQLGSINVDWGASHQIMRIPVLFTFTDWKEAV